MTHSKCTFIILSIRIRERTVWWLTICILSFWLCTGMSICLLLFIKLQNNLQVYILPHSKYINTYNTVIINVTIEYEKVIAPSFLLTVTGLVNGQPTESTSLNQSPKICLNWLHSWDKRSASQIWQKSFHRELLTK